MPYAASRRGRLDARTWSRRMVRTIQAIRTRRFDPIRSVSTEPPSVRVGGRRPPLVPSNGTIPGATRSHRRASPTCMQSDRHTVRHRRDGFPSWPPSAGPLSPDRPLALRSNPDRSRRRRQRQETNGGGRQPGSRRTHAVTPHPRSRWNPSHLDDPTRNLPGTSGLGRGCPSASRSSLRGESVPWSSPLGPFPSTGRLTPPIATNPPRRTVVTNRLAATIATRARTQRVGSSC